MNVTSKKHRQPRLLGMFFVFGALFCAFLITPSKALSEVPRGVFCYRQARERAGILSFILIPTWMVSAYGRTGLIWSRLKAFTTGGFWMTSLQGQQLRVRRSCCGLSLEGEILL